MIMNNIKELPDRNKNVGKTNGLKKQTEANTVRNGSKCSLTGYLLLYI